MGRRRKEENRDLVPGLYRHEPSNTWRVKDQKGKFKYFGDKRYEEAVKFAQHVHSLKTETDNLSVLIEQYLVELPKRTNNKPSTIQAKTWRLNKWVENIGHLSILDIDHIVLQQIFDTMTPSAYQNHRKDWVKFGEWVVAVPGLWDKNYAEMTLAIQVTREKERHTNEGYQKIYDEAEEWLQIAMELAVSSLQDLSVLCALTNDDIQNGRLLLTREKTGANLGIEIATGSRLYKAIKRSKIQFTAGDTLIRRKPKRRRPGKDWSRVNPQTLSKAFKDARDSSGAYDHIDPSKRPDWRALRSYGAHLYREAGYPDQYIQALLAHKDVKMTDYYTDSGYEPRFIDVKAEL